MLKKNIAAFFFVASAFTLSESALADGGLFVEPGVTYQQYDSSITDPAESNGFDYKFNNGTGYRVGAGFHAGIVSLNLEYQKINYSNTTVEKLGPLTGNSDSIKFNGDGRIGSVSFPLEM